MAKSPWMPFLFLFLLDCGSGNKNSSVSKLTDGSTPAFLGHGYDHLKLEKKLNKCVEGTVVTTPDSQVVTQFNKIENWQRLQAQLGFDIPGAIHVDGNDEKANFVMRSRDSHLTATYVLNYLVYFKKEVLSNPKIVEGLTDKDFPDNCGTRYISTLSIGGKLHVGFKFSFSSESFKESFEGKGAVSSPTGLKARVTALNQDVRSNSSVEIFFHQIGGDLTELEHMFNSNDIVKCSLDQFATCEKLLVDIYNYTTNNFSKAVSEGKHQVIDFSSESYGNNKVFYEDMSVVQDRQIMLDKLDEHYYDRDLVNNYKVHINLVQSTTRDLSKISTHIGSNIRILKEAISLSFRDPERFKEYYSSSKIKLYEYSLPEVVEKKNPYWYFTKAAVLTYGGAAAMAVAVPLIYKFLGVKKAAKTSKWSRVVDLAALHHPDSLTATEAEHHAGVQATTTQPLATSKEKHVSQQ